MKYLLAFACFLLFFTANAQYDTMYLSVAPFISATSKGQAFAKKAESMAISAVHTDYRMILVDRDLSSAVKWEREFQKSEDFIDGKIVEQGKATGADYVLDGHYDHTARQLRMAIYDVNSGDLKCSVIANDEKEKKKKKRTGVLNLHTLKIEWDEPAQAAYPSRSAIQSGIQHLFENCFPKKTWAVLRPTEENKSKVKEILIAAGSRMDLRKGNRIEILVTVTEDVDGMKLERLESAGWGKILYVESENFSVVKLEAGEKNIKKQLAGGKKLRCRTLKRH